MGQYWDGERKKRKEENGKEGKVIFCGVKGEEKERARFFRIWVRPLSHTADLSRIDYSFSFLREKKNGWGEKGEKMQDQRGSAKRQRDFLRHRWREKKRKQVFFVSLCALVVGGGATVKGSTFFPSPHGEVCGARGIYLGFDCLRGKKLWDSCLFYFPFVFFFLYSETSLMANGFTRKWPFGWINARSSDKKERSPCRRRGDSKACVHAKRKRRFFSFFRSRSLSACALQKERSALFPLFFFCLASIFLFSSLPPRLPNGE